MAVEARNRNIEHENRRTAWLAANIMNCWTKRRITVDRLLGGSSKGFEETPFSSVEDLNRHLAKKKTLRAEGE